MPGMQQEEQLNREDSSEGIQEELSFQLAKICVLLIVAMRL